MNVDRKMEDERESVCGTNMLFLQVEICLTEKPMEGRAILGGEVAYHREDSGWCECASFPIPPYHSETKLKRRAKKTFTN